jgi:TolB-like protein/class 3 adenylate cyclase
LTKSTDTERRLVALFAADVEGYSRLMGADEVGTLCGLTERRAILDKAITDRRGRIANTAGDSVLAEFGSAVDAVQCAVEAQTALAETNSAPSPDRRIDFRIGVHVGDVMVRAGDLFGDGVNIAARLQTIAKPGGICVSGATYDQVRKILAVDFTDLGAQRVKNIEEPVRAYSVGKRSEIDSSATKELLSPSELGKPPSLPDKPSIAVLPFQNMSGDPEQEYFADGMVEEIITALSRRKGLFVIARNSSFFYKGKQFDVRQVGKELGVRYVLEGSVRKTSGKVRITGQLIDAANGAHLWADRFDGELEDIFDLQDKVTINVVGAIAPQIERAEIERSKRKPTENLNVYDFYLRGLSANNQHPVTRSGAYASRDFWLRSVELDPTLALAWGSLATLQCRFVSNGWFVDQEAHAREGVDAARRALSLDKDDPCVLARAGIALSYLGGLHEEGLALAEESTSLDPNSAIGWAFSGLIADYLGNHDAAIERALRALRLSPKDPLRFLTMTTLARSLFCSGRHEEAASWVKEELKISPNRLGALQMAIASNALAGRMAEAHEALQKLLSLQPKFSISEFLRGTPWHVPVDRARMVEGLRLAGLPE